MVISVNSHEGKPTSSDANQTGDQLPQRSCLNDESSETSTLLTTRLTTTQQKQQAAAEGEENTKDETNFSGSKVLNFFENEKIQDIFPVEDSQKFFHSPRSHTNDHTTSTTNVVCFPHKSTQIIVEQRRPSTTVVKHYRKEDVQNNIVKPVMISNEKGSSETVRREKAGESSQLFLKKKMFKRGLKSDHVKDLLMMQLDLIGHQQLKIMEKDKQIISLQNEKEQLEAKLSRMERRISVQKRHHLEISASQEEAGNLSLTTRSRIVSSPLVKSAIVPSSTISKKTESDKNLLSDKLNTLPVTVTSCNDKGFCFENFLRTNVTYLDPPIKKRICLNTCFKKDEIKIEKLEERKVPVPPWRIINQKPIEVSEEINLEGLEDTSDAAYDKRHSKPEQEEKRRKRWDLQQARQQRQHEMLVQKYMERQKDKLQGNPGDFLSPSNQSKQSINSSSNNTVDTLIKESDSVYAVEVTEIVPVCAFGYPLPSLVQRELELPWFNIAKREVQLRTAKERLMTRSKKKAIMTQKKRRSCRT